MNANPILVGALFGFIGFGLTFFLNNEDSKDKSFEEMQEENKKLKEENDQLKQNNLIKKDIR